MFLRLIQAVRAICLAAENYMNFDFLFFVNSTLLGAGLAMDAFSVSIANALLEPGMKRLRMYLIAGCYAFFQFFMPVIGWICVRTVIQLFSSFQLLVPWIALVLLSYIGGKMLWSSFHPENDSEDARNLSLAVLFIQGIATSIDALSVGFTISDYNLFQALAASFNIAAVTFVICMAGLKIGKTVGNCFCGKAEFFGGIILIAIGLEIFIRSIL